MKKVCLLTRTTVVNDRQTLSEAAALGRAGLRVVVIGLLRANLAEHEHYENFEIHRIPPVGLMVGSRSRPKRKASSQSRRSSPRKRLSGVARKLPRPLRSAATAWCLLQAAWKENAAYYHAHSPISLMLGLLAVAKLRRSRFVADYNDILVLEKTGKVTDRYELDDLWGGELSDADRDRIEATVRLIPNEVKSILDVGCGDGRLTNLLQGAFDRVVGLDISETALRYVNGETSRASAADIPFPDHSFDTVISTETIEHLPHDVYSKAVKEIKRVAKDWIVIGVPWREQLSIGFVRCARCKMKFHVNLHFRNFNYGIMADLLRPEWRMVDLEKSGTDRQYYAPPLLWIRQQVAGIWTRTPSTICPRCNIQLFPGNSREANTLSLLCNKANNKIKKYIKTDKSHCIAVYKRVKRDACAAATRPGGDHRSGKPFGAPMTIVMITVLDVGVSLGHANHFLSIAREFSKLGHRLGLIVPRPAPGGESLPVEGAEWQFTLPARRLGLPNNLSTFCQILPILLRWKTTRIDILYVRASMFSFVYGMLFRLSRKTIVVSEHNGWYEDERRSLGRRTWLCGLERVCQVLDATFADRVGVVTHRIKDILVAQGVDHKKIHVIPNGTDPDAIRPTAREKALVSMGLDPGLLYVGFLGHLTPWQGVEVAIEAMAILANADPRVRLLIGGHGVMREPLESRVRDCGLGHRVIFLGAVPRGRVCEVLSSFDVAIAPYIRRRNERIGLSALKIRDYAAAGRAVVAADLPGIRELAEAGWLLLHRPDDPRSLADEVLNLLHDPARRREMGCKARIYAVANLSWGLTAERILNMIAK